MEKINFQLGNFFCFFLRFHFFTSPSRFATSSCFDHESQAGPLNVRRRMRLGHHCRAPPLAVQPSPAPTIRHGGGARRVGAGARRWADLQASVTSTGPVCGQTNPGGRGEIVVGAPQSADKSFFDESTSSVWQVVAKFVRPCISLSCCVTFLRATYAFKCCSQIARRKRGNPSVPGKVAHKNQPRDRAGTKLQPNQLCTRPACQQVRYFARRAARCAQE